MPVPAKVKENNGSMVWTHLDDIQLLSAIGDGLMPFGINKHLIMANIVERLSKALGRNISSKDIWARFRHFYNMDILEEEKKQIAIPLEPVEFSLPHNEFGTLIKKKQDQQKKKRRRSYRKR